MSDYHVMNGSEDGKSYRIVFHIPIPDVNNRAGVSYRTAVAEHFNQTSIVPNLDLAEQTAMTNGEIYEHVENYKTHPSHGSAADRDALDDRFNTLKTEQRDRIQRVLEYWGFKRDVA